MVRNESKVESRSRFRKRPAARERSAGFAAIFCAGVLSVSVANIAAAANAAAPANAAGAPSFAGPSTARAAAPVTGLIYDTDYPFIGYSGTPEHNDVARLAARIARGEVKLKFSEPRGYLDSLLAALHIDPSSQSLVFSKTSLQADAISAQTPRAIYFNDDTYVGWISGSNLLEISTMDGMMGTVFYTVRDSVTEPAHFERETTRCLSCHDTFSLSGGGVPNFLFLSAYSRGRDDVITNDVAYRTTDGTPLAERWGGWYVTGQLGHLRHLGNILPSPAGRIPLSQAGPRNLAVLDGLFDTRPYLSDKSDVVALLVLQHQVDIHNLIIHANYKCRMLMERNAPGSSTKDLPLTELPAALRRQLAELLEPLVRGMLFVDAAKITTPVRGNSGFAESFEARGPRDTHGRSLRDFDLRTRLFKYPLSFLVYSEGFDFLPAAAKQYVYQRFDEILTGRDTSAAFSHLSTADRRAILEILRDTKPDFAHAVAPFRDAANAMLAHRSRDRAARS